MNNRERPILHRDNPGKDPLVGHIKVTREDWLNIARDVLVHEGVGELKIAVLAQKLGVSRSSFYWYFENRSDLLNALLEEWEARNTGKIVAQCTLPSDSITEAVTNFFRCFVDDESFDAGLDFAVREWARRDKNVRDLIDKADKHRLGAVTGLFQRHGFSDYDADARARIVYFMQIGYHALELRETMQVRLERAVGFLRGFTGEEPDPRVVSEFKAFALSKETTS